MINIKKQLDYIRRISELPCTKEQIEEDYAAYNSCFAKKMYGDICTDIRLAYNILQYLKKYGEGK